MFRWRVKDEISNNNGQRNGNFSDAKRETFSASHCCV